MQHRNTSEDTVNTMLGLRAAAAAANFLPYRHNEFFANSPEKDFFRLKSQLENHESSNNNKFDEKGKP